MSDPSVLTEAAVLTQVNKWVGVTIALVGAFVAAPDGARLLFRSSATWIRTQINRFRKSPPHEVKVVGVAGNVRLGSLKGTATVRVWRPDDPVDVRIEALRMQISDVEGRLNQATSALREERSARKEAVTELSRTLHARLDELHQLLNEKDQQMATIDARGLPVIGFGVLLSGVPEGLAEIPWHLGWILPFVGFAWMVMAVLESLRAHRAAPHTPPG